METDKNVEYSIIIDYDDFLTRFDLDEILSSLDRMIEDELLSGFDDYYDIIRRRGYYPYPYLFREDSGLSYIGITAVDRGSIALTIIVSPEVLTYVMRRFMVGVNKSLLAKEVSRSVKITDALLGNALMRINDWAERWVPEQRELGGKVKALRMEKKHKNDGP
jgi:hypothetical protein